MSENLLDRVQQLAAVWGPSGREQRVADLIEEMITPFVDEVRRDRFGNLLAIRDGQQAIRDGKEGGRRVLLTAHMDTPGAIALNVSEKGLIYLAPVGGMKAHQVVGQRVAWGSGSVGILQSEHIEEAKELEFKRLFCDIGADSKAAALEQVALGDMCTLVGGVDLMGELLVGAALDNRVGCAVLVEVAEHLAETEHTVIFAFTSQGEVAARGAAVAAFGAEPDLALLVDSALSGDQPRAPRLATKLGGGPALRLKDSGYMAHHALAETVKAVAEAESIPLQIAISPTGSEGQIVTSAGTGIPTAVIDIPVRYQGTGNEMAHRRDLYGAADLLLKLLGQPLDLA